MEYFIGQARVGKRDLIFSERTRDCVIVDRESKIQDQKGLGGQILLVVQFIFISVCYRFSLSGSQIVFFFKIYSKDRYLNFHVFLLIFFYVHNEMPKMFCSKGLMNFKIYSSIPTSTLVTSTRRRALNFRLKINLLICQYMLILVD